MLANDQKDTQHLGITLLLSFAVSHQVLDGTRNVVPNFRHALYLLVIDVACEHATFHVEQGA